MRLLDQVSRSSTAEAHLHHAPVFFKFSALLHTLVVVRVFFGLLLKTVCRSAASKIHRPARLAPTTLRHPDSLKSLYSDAQVELQQLG